MNPYEGRAVIGQYVKKAIAPNPGALRGALKSLLRHFGKGKQTLLIMPQGFRKLINSDTIKTLSDMEAFPSVITPAKFKANAKFYHSKFNVVDLDKGKQFVLPDEYESKLREIKDYGKFMAPSTRLSGIKGDLMKGLNTKFPEGEGWILKGDTDAATKVKDLMSRDNIKNVLRQGRKLKITMRNGRVRTLDPSTLLAQQMHDISLGPVASAVDTVASKLSPLKKIYGSHMGLTNRGTNEYRVHVLGGKVVPYGTSHRGSLVGNMLTSLLPFRLPSTNKVESFAQQVADSMKGRARSGLYGMDIGIERASGKPFLIETNPTTSTGASGFLDSPFGAEAISSHLAGKLPNSIMARRALLGVGGAGALGAGAMALAPGAAEEAENISA